MRSRLLAMAALLVVVCGAAALTLREARSAAPPGDTREILYYQCPMHPSYRSDRPGKAADCGMALVPVYASPPRDSNALADPGQAPQDIQVEDRKQRLAGFQTEAAAESSFQEIIRTSGRVVPDETRDFSIVAAADGWILSVPKEIATGLMVRRGQTLAEVNGRDFTAAQRTFLYALRALEMGGQSQSRPTTDAFGQDPSTVLEEARLDLRRLGMSDAQIERLQSTRQVEVTVPLESPIAGVVTRRATGAERSFTGGDELFRVVDLSRVWVLADISEADLALRSHHQPITVSLPSRQESSFDARVGEALPLTQGSGQAVKVRLDVDNAEGHLRPGMLVDVQLPIDIPKSIVIDADAIISTGARDRVFVKRDQQTFEPRDVVVGRRFNGRAQVLSGLAVGESVVVAGAFLLDSEQRIGSTLSRR